LGAKFDIVEIPEDLKEQVEEYREKLIEKAVEEDGGGSKEASVSARE
jgi:elongation factor G